MKRLISVLLGAAVVMTAVPFSMFEALAADSAALEYSRAQWSYLTHFEATDNAYTEHIFTASEDGVYAIGAFSPGSGLAPGLAVSIVELKTNDKLSITLGAESTTVSELGLSASKSSASGGNSCNLQPDASSSALAANEFARKYIPSDGSGSLASAYAVPAMGSSALGCVVVEMLSEHQISTLADTEWKPVGNYDELVYLDGKPFGVKTHQGITYAASYSGTHDSNFAPQEYTNRLRIGYMYFEQTGVYSYELPKSNNDDGKWANLYWVIANGITYTMGKPTIKGQSNAYYSEYNYFVSIDEVQYGLSSCFSSKSDSEGNSSTSNYYRMYRYTPVNTGLSKGHVLKFYGAGSSGFNSGYRSATYDIYLAKDIDTIRGAFDTTPPTAPAISLSPSSEWSTQDVTATIGGSTDDGVGVSRYEYSFDNGASWSIYSAPLTISSYCTLWARAVDGAGNLSTVTKREVKIDKATPSVRHELSPDIWCRETVISIAAEDDLSGVESITLPDGAKITS